MGLAGIVVAGLLSAFTGRFVDVSTTTFSSKDASLDHTLVVMPLNDEQNSSLQFHSVADGLMQKLYLKGFRAPVEGQKPDYVAFVTYGIDDGHSRLVSVPRFGQTGGGTAVTNGTVFGAGGYGTFNATTTTMPTFGVVGQNTFSQTTYRRAFNLDIYDVRSGTPSKVYEVRAKSEGTCGNINSVIDQISDGAVDKFPGENGRTTTSKRDWSGRC